MGYQVKKTICKLIFDDPDYEGLVVRVKSPPMGVFIDMAGFMESDTDVSSLTDVAEIDKLFGYFVDALVEWNLEDDGEPVPQTFDGLRSLDLMFAMDMIMAWLSALTGMTPGLAKPSGSGQPSLEAEIPMEALSESQAS